MQLRQPPKDNDDAILQMWTALIGLNGSGLISRFESLEETVVTKDVCEAHHKFLVRKTARAERIFFIVLAVFSFLFGDNIISAIKGLFGG